MLEAYTQGRQPSVELFVNPFQDLRQTMMSMTHWWDEGLDSDIQDLECETSAINYRVRFLAVAQHASRTCSFKGFFISGVRS